MQPQFNSIDGTLAREETLLKSAQRGNSMDLETLLLIHYPWVQRRVRSVVWDDHDADDTTQEIFLRALSSINSMENALHFRAWLQTVVKNFLISLSTIHSQTDSQAHSLEYLQDTQSEFSLYDEHSTPGEHLVLMKETRDRFLVGMLLCLEPRQRLILLLGDVVGVVASEGSALLDLSADNFRRVLCDARRDIRNFIENNCTLQNPSCSCRCPRKSHRYIKNGFVDPEKRVFYSEHEFRLAELASHLNFDLERFLQTRSPYLKHNSNRNLLREILEDSELCSSLDLDANFTGTTNSRPHD